MVSTDGKTVGTCPACQGELGASSGICPKCGFDSTAATLQLSSTQRAGVEGSAAFSASDLMPQLTAALAPRIQVLEQLGAGGMGAVFLGRDPVLKRSVAIKILSRELADDERSARFLREAESAARVEHPNVVAIYETGQLASGVPFFVMQLVDGTSLGAVIASDGVFSESRAKRAVGEVAAALTAAHARGLVHRDIKPANIMIERSDGRAVVLDFGISAVIDPATFGAVSTLTAKGSYVGTPTHASPEQAAGKTVTDRSDVYALGVVAFELLTGKLPFSGNSVFELMAAHLREQPPKLTDLRPDIDPGFARLVDQCLAKDPASRPSAAELVAYLIPARESTIEWPPPGLEHIKGKGVHLLRTVSVALVLSYLLLLSNEFWSVFKASWYGDVEWMTVFAVMAASVLAFLVLQSLRVMGLVVQARRAGYPPRLIADVTFDSSPDSNDLRNGFGEYAIVAPNARIQILRLARARTAIWGLAVVATITLLGLWLGGVLSVGTAPGHRLLSDADFLTLLLPGVVAVLFAGFAAQKASRLRPPRSSGSARLLRGLRPAAPHEVVRGWLAGARMLPPKSRWSLGALILPIGAAMLLAVGGLAWLAVHTAIEDSNRRNRRDELVPLDGNKMTTRGVLLLDAIESDILRAPWWSDFVTTVSASSRVKTRPEVSSCTCGARAVVRSCSDVPRLSACWCASCLPSVEAARLLSAAVVAHDPTVYSPRHLKALQLDALVGVREDRLGPSAADSSRRW